MYIQVGRAFLQSKFDKTGRFMVSWGSFHPKNAILLIGFP